MARITVQEASITTVQVEIQALRVGAKQMTLSIFRQLPLDPAWTDENGKLLGIPWGRVNYFWSGCGIDDYTWWNNAAIHVVWQHGAVLKRILFLRKYLIQEHLDYLESLPQLFIAV